MSASFLSFDAAGIAVEVRSELPQVTRALEAVWRPALRETGASDLVYEVNAEGRLSINGRALTQIPEHSRIVPRIEGHVLEALAAENHKALTLHCGAVIFGEQLVLFVGEANSGKSSLTRASLRRGAKYLTDDMLVFDGPSCRGLARSIHFDPLPVDELENAPAYFADCDLESYRFRARDGRSWTTPIWHGEFETIRRYAPEAGKTVLVVIERGDEEGIRALAPIERAAALVGGSLAAGAADWGQVPEGPSFRLVWNRDPEISLEGLLERIDLTP